MIGIGIISIFAYSAYWSFEVRSALFNRLYRDRALWAATAASFFALLVLSNILIGGLDPTNFYLSIALFSIGYAGAALTFAWIDTTVRVAIRADPLRRNTLHWAGLRKFIWVTLALGIFFGIFGVLLHGTNYFSPAGAGGAYLYGPYASNAVFTIPGLVLCRRRTGDGILKNHLKWLLIFVIVLFFATSLLNNPTKSVPQNLGAVLLLVDAYAIYKAARSLTTVSRLPVSDG